MATFSFNVPSGTYADLTAALRAALGDEAQGLTDHDVLMGWLRRQLRPVLRAYRLRGQVASLVQAEEAARATAEQAMAAERQARLAAEATVAAQADADVEGVA